MQFRRMLFFVGLLCLAGAFILQQQANAQTPPGSGPVIQTETRLVLVDTVVTDKKENYLRDLTAKDFRVWEDNKEQTIKSFSFEDSAAPSSSRTRYLVLFFDNSTMNPGDQLRARQAAAKFIETNAGPDRLIAIVNFGGALRIAQNFTADAERLKQVVSGVKPDAQRPPVEVASLAMPRLGNAEAQFGARSVLLALRSLAKNVSSVPGRKTLVLFTAGFPLTLENRSELTAVIDACNRANVAVYPIDVRGLMAMGAAVWAPSSPYPARPPMQLSSFVTSFAQRPGGGGAPGGGGGSQGGSQGGSRGGSGGGFGGGPPGGMGGGSNPGGSGSTGRGGGTVGPGSGGSGGTGGTPGSGGSAGKGGTTGGGGSTANPGGNTGGRGAATGGGGGRTSPVGQPYATSPYNQPRLIIPEFPETASTNQQVLYALAQGTGGFVITNTNDMLRGLERIAKEQNEYYILGYSPSDSPEGSCHTLRVKVNRGGTVVRSRSGYCNVKPVDLLAGTPIEKDLESRVSDSAPGNVAASMAAPFFYTSPNTARVNVAIEIPSGAMRFEKVKGKLHSEVNVLGIAYRPDGAVAARFSDTLKLDLENKKELEEFGKQPLHYENQFDVASGSYNLKVVFSSGRETFGKLEAPLAIDPYDSKQFSLSAIALSREIRQVSDVGLGLDAALLEGRTPLVARGWQITPTGTSRFKKGETALMYVEVYAPLLVEPNPPVVAIQIRVVDRKTGEQKQDSGFVNVEKSIQPGNPVIPLGLKLQVASLNTGAYRAEVKAMDSAGNASILRTAEFDLE